MYLELLIFCDINNFITDIISSSQIDVFFPFIRLLISSMHHLFYESILLQYLLILSFRSIDIFQIHLFFLLKNRKVIEGFNLFLRNLYFILHLKLSVIDISPDLKPSRPNACKYEKILMYELDDFIDTLLS